MPRLAKQALIQKFIRAIQSRGWNILYLSSIRLHPIDLQIFNKEESYKVRLYIWNITPGGRNRPPDEYRIQITGVDHFTPVPEGKTLIMGWWEDVGVFAGWDYFKHRGRLGRSPSLQIRQHFLEQAYSDGFSVYDKGNRELAAAIRPDFLVDYIRNLEDIHKFGEIPNAELILDEISSASAQGIELNESIIAKVPEERRRVISQVNRALRSTNFRAKVLTAYNNKCAICGIQLELVEAAHIIPVGHPRSNDEIYNGIALCSLHHKAFDKALIGVSADYHIIVNESEFQRLRSLRLEAGELPFKGNLRPLIILPPAVNDRPNVQFLELALRIRNFSR